MNFWFLAAAVMSVLTCAIHCLAGEKFIVRPLLAQEQLAAVPKYTAYYCWHLVSIVLAGMALGFFRAALAPGGRELAAVFVVFATLAAIWSFSMVRRYRLRLWQFPQGLLFVPVALFGAAGLWV